MSDTFNDRVMAGYQYKYLHEADFHAFVEVIVQGRYFDLREEIRKLQAEIDRLRAERDAAHELGRRLGDERLLKVLEDELLVEAHAETALVESERDRLRRALERIATQCIPEDHLAVLIARAALQGDDDAH